MTYLIIGPIPGEGRIFSFGLTYVGGDLVLSRGILKNTAQARNWILSSPPGK
jgi:hypothetical protein